jgi:putative transposase
MIGIGAAGRKRSPIALHRRIGFGTASRRLSAVRLPPELAVRFTHKKQYFVSEASVYRLLKGHDLITSPAYIVIKAAEEFKDKTTAPNQLWQTDFTYLKVTGWGWYYLSTVLDDFSRFIVASKLCATMKALDVTATLDLALTASGLDQMTVVHRPRLLSDNGASYVATDLAQWLDQQKMEHVRSVPYHPQTQGKIEGWHQTLKNRILLEHYYLPGDLERQVAAFVEHYNHDRYHEGLDNLTPADVYFGRAETVLLERERIKRQTIANRQPKASAPRRGDYAGPRSALLKAKLGAPAPQVEKVPAPDAVRCGASRRAQPDGHRNNAPAVCYNTLRCRTVN